MKDIFCSIKITKAPPTILTNDNGEIIININDKNDLEKLTSNIEKELKKHLKDCEKYGDELEKENILCILNRIQNGAKIIISEAEVMNIPKDLEEIISYLPENINFKFINFTNDELLYILKKYHFKENTKFYYQYNLYDVYKKDKIIDTILYIKEITSYIEKYNLSPLEIIMLVYDLVREREYKKSNNSEIEQSYSRDLSRVMDSEEIVCAGYATICAAILNEIGIKTEIMKWHHHEKNTPGHASIVCYINDSKYNVHQIFEIDPTWRRKKSNDDCIYINDYNTYCLSLNESITHKKKNNLLLSNYPSMLYTIIKKNKINQQYKSLLPNSIMQKNNIIVLLRNIKNYLNLIGLEEEAKKCNALINKIENENVTIETINSEIEDILHKIGIIDEKIRHQSLQIEVFVKALYQVRRIEHSIDSRKYPLSLDEIQNIVNNREEFIRLLKYGSPSIALINCILNNENIDEITEEQIQKLIDDNVELKDITEDKINIDMKRMELLSCLRQISHINIENPILPKNRTKSKRK